MSRAARAELVTCAALGIALSTAATASAQPACPTVAVDQTAAAVCAAEAAVHDAQTSLDQAQVLLAAAQAGLAPPPYVVPVPRPAVVVADPLGPRAHSLTFEYAEPLDVTFVPHGLVASVPFGLAFGLGYRLTRSFELGWTADAAYLMAHGDLPGDGYLRFRTGVETRYRFGAGSPQPGASMLSTPWLGARAGLELLDNIDGDGTTRGAYADVSAGIDWWVVTRHGHHQQLGAYVSLGMSVEPLTAYATVTTTALASQPTSALGVPTVASPYVAIAMRHFW